METVCRKHKRKPALIYGPCVGCELDGLRKQVEDLQGSLKVLHTWASHDIDEGRQLALDPAHVVALCDRALGRR